MTEKKAAFGNNFTPEQRAAEMRAARAEYLGRVKSGEVGIAESRRVAGIGQRQAEKLIELFG